MADGTREDPGPHDARSERDAAAAVRDRGAALIDALDRHLPGAREHAEATGSYAFAAAVELGHDRERSELIREAAKLHEVGKVYLPSELLARPPEELAAEERSQVAEHHEAGFRLARGAGVPDEACGWILRFRERFDGGGVEGLAAEAIPIEARIARAACACDRALCAPPQRGDTGPAERGQRAIDDLRAAGGRELDPRVVDAMAEVIARASSA